MTDGWTPVFINCRDRVAHVQQLVAWLEQAEGVGDIVLVDNASTYQALLDWYASQSHRVVRLRDNVGPNGVWQSGILLAYNAPQFIVTDDDVVPREDCPMDAVLRMRERLAAHPTWRGVGLAIEYEDLPAHYHVREAVIEHESRFWRDRAEPGLWKAAIDSANMPMYRKGRDWMCTFDQVPYLPLLPGVQELLFDSVGGETRRFDRPYVVRHLPWYLDWAALPDDERYYLRHMKPGCGACWSENHRGPAVL